MCRASHEMYISECYRLTYRVYMLLPISFPRQMMNVRKWLLYVMGDLTIKFPTPFSQKGEHCNHFFSIRSQHSCIPFWFECWSGQSFLLESSQTAQSSICTISSTTSYDGSVNVSSGWLLSSIYINSSSGGDWCATQEGCATTLQLTPPYIIVATSPFKGKFQDNIWGEEQAHHV